VNAAAPAIVALCAAPALAQPFAVDWASISGGGSTTPSTGGSFGVAGIIGAYAGGQSGGGAFTVTGGFLAAIQPGTCYANCDGSTTPPSLNVADFTCFLQRYAAGDNYANCDGSTTPPTLNVADFTCFLQRFAAGCP
jgi:hypothetical protein